jgi:hypothetical protein
MGNDNCYLIFRTSLLILWVEYHPVEHRLNCSSISHDGSLVVGGFSDSSVKVSPFRSNVFFHAIYIRSS